MDTAPTQTIASGSPAAPVASTVVSMYQTNSTAIICERRFGFALTGASAAQSLLRRRMGDLIVMADVKQQKQSAAAFDELFWVAVGNMVRDHVDREIKNLRAGFEMKLEEACSALSYQGTHEPGNVYTRGMFVTANGSLWHCNNVTHRSAGDDHRIGRFGLSAAATGKTRPWSAERRTACEGGKDPADEHRDLHRVRWKND